MRQGSKFVLEKSAPGRCIHFYPGASRSQDTSHTESAGMHAGSVEAAQSSLTGPDILASPLRESAEELIAEAIEAELRIFRAEFAGLRDARGREMVVRNGLQPPREIETAVGRIAVRIPKLRSRDGGRVTFRSVFIPHYVHRADAVDASHQCKYLNSLRLCDLTGALKALFNGRLRYVPTPVMEHLRLWWPRHCADMRPQWNARCFEGEADIWADAVPAATADEGSRSCVLALVGTDKTNRRRFLSISEVDCSSAAAWREVLLGLKQSRLLVLRKIAVGARAVGFDDAFADVFAPTARLATDAKVDLYDTAIV